MLVLARLKSFSKTAIEMNLSQSTISARVADLERELDRKMFTRNHHSVALTPAGSIFLPYAKKAVQDYEQGRWHINSIETFDDRLAIGNVNSALGNFLLPVYVDFMRAYPRISIHAAIGAFVGYFAAARGRSDRRRDQLSPPEKQKDTQLGLRRRGLRLCGRA